MSDGACRAEELIMSAGSKLPTIARILLGLAFTVFGLNFFLHFLPDATPPPASAAFFAALVSGKIMSIVKIVELACGLALLANRFVPLALTLLAPVEVGILTYHAVFDPSGLAVIGVLVALTVYLARAYRSAFAPMLRAEVAPG
jgi:putative oxidoreductase